MRTNELYHVLYFTGMQDGSMQTNGISFVTPTITFLDCCGLLRVRSLRDICTHLRDGDEYDGKGGDLGLRMKSWPTKVKKIITKTQEQWEKDTDF